MGDLSQLLAEIAQVPDEGSSWREALKPGDEVGRYQIRREIGRGGFGAVYEAFDPQLGRVVALKALKPGRTRRIFSEEWIQKEAEAVAKLDHPAIVTIHDVGTCPAGAYLVMELLQGETLAERIGRGPLPVDEALRVAEQMAEGLAHAHSRGVLHRDLKPANVFLCADGRVKLLDFGLAHLLGTDGSSGAGTPAYMAPEQAAGASVDERADVYAAAMVLGEMLTGRRPVERATPRGPSPEPPSSKTELMWEGGKAPAADGARAEGPKLDGVPRPVARVVKAALSANPEERPKDGAKWLAELRSARLVRDRPRRARRVAVLTAVGVVLGLTFAGFATWRIWERQIPGGRPTVAVADFANETGEQDLDSIAGLLITSLEQGTQLRVLTRSRMLDVLKQLGKADVHRIDETLAREVGREARANALLLATIRRLGEAYVVELRALDPLHDEYVFTLSDRATAKPAVFDLVDRLAVAVRKRMGRPEGTAPEAPIRIAAITTSSPKAWDLLARSRGALDGARRDEAIRLAEEALVEDPDFALAHYQLATMRPYSAIWRHWAQEPDPHLAAAELLSARLPEKERLVLRVLRSQATNRWEDARETSARLAEAYPLDKEVQFLAGVVRSGAHLQVEAIPYYRQALRLDPGYRRAVVSLVRALANTGRVDQELPWLREQARLATSSQELWSLGIAFLTENLVEEATQVFKREFAMVGGAWPSRPLLSHLVYSGRAAEAERAARDGLARLPEDAVRKKTDAARAFGTALGQALSAQGRFRETNRITEWMLEGVSLPGGRWDLGPRLWHAAAAQDFPALESATRDFEEHEGVVDAGGGTGGLALTAAEIAADAGRFDLAGPIARRVLDGRTASDPVQEGRALMTAIATAHQGPPEVALRALAQAANPSDHIWRFSARIIRGHYLRMRGDCAGAIESYEQAARVKWDPVDDTRPMFFPLMLHSLALCHEKLGNLAKARERNEEFLRLWARADPDLPLLAEAKALQARLVVK